MGRGCGTREHGKLYFETPVCDEEQRMAGMCRPIDYFLLDSPWPVDRKAMMIPDRGVAILERPGSPGIFDVWDYVGRGSYPNVPDVVEEGRRMGISRRAPMGLDYSVLDARSRLILVHDRAIVTNVKACYNALEIEEVSYGAMRTAAWVCKRKLVEHSAEKLWPPTNEDPAKEKPMCISLLWDMVEGGEFAKNPKAPARTVERTVGDTCYTARRWFERGDLVKADKPAFTSGAFLMLPLAFTAITHADGSLPLEAIKSAAGSSLSISIAEE